MADEKTQEESPKKKGKGKLLIIIIAVVVLIVAIVAVKMFVLSGKKSPSESNTQQQPIHTTNQAESGSYDNNNLKPVIIGPIIVNLADAGGDRYLKATFVLLETHQGVQKVEKEKSSTGFSLENAVIKDTIINTISAKTSDDLLSVAGKEELKNELINAINRSVHKNLVRKIFFTSFIIQ